jgi:hypothetical protein
MSAGNKASPTLAMKMNKAIFGLAEAILMSWALELNASSHTYEFYAYADIYSLVGEDPAVLARQDVKRGQKHFLGVRGFALELPGVDQTSCNLTPKSIRIIGGTSDQASLELIEAARKFAEKYNKAIVQELAGKSSKRAGMACLLMRDNSSEAVNRK